jgi:hypothetical protein
LGSPPAPLRRQTADAVMITTAIASPIDFIKTFS